MPKNFPEPFSVEITPELKERASRLLHYLISIKRRVKSKELAIFSGRSFFGSYVRKMINYLRGHEDQPIVSNSKGYLYTHNIALLDDTIESLKQREAQIRYARQGLERAKANILSGQGELNL